jgi:transcriptional regulator with XRE-family HTH domain
MPCGIVRDMTIDRERFGAELRRRRVQADLSQAELAELAGTEANTIARMERGERGASLSMAQALAAALRCRIEDLIGRAKR